MAILQTRIYRRTNSSDFSGATLLTTRAPGVTSYADTSVSHGNTYYYWFQHEYYDGEVGDVSGPISVYITPPTPTITNLTTNGETDPTKPTVTGWTWAVFNTGENTESVQWRYRKQTNGVWGSWSTWANINTIENGIGYETDHITGDPTPGDLVDFELVPYTGNLGGGTAGSTYAVQGTVGSGGA